MLLKGASVIVCSFKKDGSFHRLWENTIVVEQTENHIIVGNSKAMVTESDGRYWEAREPAITIFFKDAWFNIIAMLRPTGVHYYVNIASPFVLQQENITYIDFDLDVAMNPSNIIKILDEGEYLRHQESMNYSKDLDLQIKKSLNEVLEMCRARVYPFNDEVIIKLYDQYLSLSKTI
jgi:uncharacterized protein